MASVIPAPSTRPLRADAAANRARVLAAAAEVFHEKGLDAGMEDVARRAGVGVGTIYRRFPSRADLLETLLGDLLDAYALEAELALAMPDGTGLAHFMRTVGEVQATPRGCAQRLWSSPAAEVRRAEVHARMTELLDAAKRHGTCRTDVTLGDLVGILLALRGVREAPALRVELDWRRHLELCLVGLRPTT
ncbi:MAG: hypothetical protein JWN88_1386 [Frankiales bacterium]|nr:hypothetical protein [Frankiales bacterium]